MSDVAATTAAFPGVARLQATIAEVFNDSWDWEALRRALPPFASALREAAGATTVPVDVGAVGRFLGVREWSSLEDPQVLGVLRPIQGGFQLGVWLGGQSLPTDGQWPTSARSIVAHEVGHCLFYTPGETPGRLRIRPTPSNQRFEERFCDEFALELLLPRDRLDAVVDGRHGPSLATVAALAAAFDVRAEFAMRRVFQDLAAWPNALAFTLDRAGEPQVKRAFRGSAVPKGVTAPAVLERLRGQVALDGPVQSCNVAVAGHVVRCESGLLQGRERCVFATVPVR